MRRRGTVGERSLALPQAAEQARPRVTTSAVLTLNTNPCSSRVIFFKFLAGLPVGTVKQDTSLFGLSL